MHAITHWQRFWDEVEFLFSSRPQIMRGVTESFTTKRRNTDEDE